MLPCNIIVIEVSKGKTEVSAVDPLASMQAIENPDLQDVAEEVQAKLKKVIDSLWNDLINAVSFEKGKKMAYLGWFIKFFPKLFLLI